MPLTTNKFTGVHTALITPFTSSLELDFNALGEIIAQQKMAGINGLLMAGTTGEAPTLTLNERQQLVKFAKNNACDIAVIAGAGSNCTKDAIDMQKAMEDAGADATLHVVPYYNKPTDRGLVEHFSAIAKSAKIPIILYNASGRTGIDMNPSVTLVLAKEQEMIVGIKDANPAVDRLCDLMRRTKEARPDFLVLCGEDVAYYSYLTHGADGIIAVSSHIAAYEMLTIYQSIKNGDLVYAQKISQKLNDLYRLVFSHTNPIPIKTILFAMGMVEKQFRLPLCSLSVTDEKILLQKYQKFSFLKSFKARGLKNSEAFL